MPITRYLMPSLFLLVLISGCRNPNTTTIPTTIPTQTLIPFRKSPTPVIPTNTSLPTLTSTSTDSPTLVWVFQSGTITCPILLYHRIEDPPSPNSLAARYYTAPSDFEWQMMSLKNWGYTTIPISVLVEAITNGSLLPTRPIVITFDDGYESVYKNAFPTMQVDGFIGVLYLVGNYIGSDGYMDVGQIQAMTKDGWEIGSHSMTHPHLPAVHDQINEEGGQSKNRIASKIGVGIETFAYPYGEIDSFVVRKIAEYGYKAAVGLGTNYINGMDTLYYLSRIEVRNGTDLAAFEALLPWSTPP